MVQDDSLILVTGGAGFVGSHLVDSLLQRGYRVRVLDSFVEQVHGKSAPRLPHSVEVIEGDLHDHAVVRAALEGVEIVFHQAAALGVAQSMYEIEQYVAANTLGTARLLELLVERRPKIRKLIVASSMSIYGEGTYHCRRCGLVTTAHRPVAQLEAHDWEVRCSLCQGVTEPIPTAETKPLYPASVYAITKQDQEQLCLLVGRAYGIPTVALRYFNVYGPRQALSNPYTGVAAIISGRLLNRQPPIIFEDGLQSRDFVHVNDVVQANLRALESETAHYKAINVGTGTATTINRVAELISEGLGASIEPIVLGHYREGDTRHCFADISLARKLLGYEPSIPIERGIPQLLEWVSQQQAFNCLERATDELQLRGLIH